MLPAPIPGGGDGRREIDEVRRPKEWKVEVYWCKAYQKNTCIEKHPHMAQIRPDEHPVPVVHMCAHCFQKENRREEHPEVECPVKK